MEEEEGGGRDFLFSHFLFYSVVCLLERNQKKKRKSAKKKRAKKKTENTGGESSLELLPSPSKTPHSLVCVRSLGPARSHRRTNERIRSIHFPTARNGLEVNFDRKWIKSCRVELVAADERHAAPRVAFSIL